MEMTTGSNCGDDHWVQLWRWPMLHTHNTHPHLGNPLSHAHTLVLSHNVWVVCIRQVSEHLPLSIMLDGREGITC